MKFVALEVLPFAERAKTAGIVTLQGMLTIFLVLALLWGAIEILHKCLSKDRKKTETETTEEPAKAMSDSSDDAVLVAVITAAVSASAEHTDPGKKFRVVSFKRAE